MQYLNFSLKFFNVERRQRALKMYLFQYSETDAVTESENDVMAAAEKCKKEHGITDGKSD
jgi:hypothetical protein